MMYYNYLNDKMEELDPEYHALNLPKSKEEYEQNIKDEIYSYPNSLEEQKIWKDYVQAPHESVFDDALVKEFFERKTKPLPTVGDEVQELEERKGMRPKLQIFEDCGSATKEEHDAWKKKWEELDPNKQDSIVKALSYADDKADPFPLEMLEKPLIEHATEYQWEINKLHSNIHSNMPATTYPITNGETSESAVPVTAKDKRESFYDVRANQFAKKQVDNLPSFMYGASPEAYREESEELGGFEIYQGVSKRGKYLAMFMLGCAVALTLYVYFNGITK